MPAVSPSSSSSPLSAATPASTAAASATTPGRNKHKVLNGRVFLLMSSLSTQNPNSFKRLYYYYYYYYYHYYYYYFIFFSQFAEFCKLCNQSDWFRRAEISDLAHGPERICCVICCKNLDLVYLREKRKKRGKKKKKKKNSRKLLTGLGGHGSVMGKLCPLL